ncbi:unnamed protein product [Vitrella brassicaformis CCMP3155]|uniref:Transmembrane protein n=1 Tax=Vitrella brassicaformis (strain CCMP3155) TaxID=1169540 RepID=A0A0G4H0E0_VITBC|nr:unnamed protein product [Vitrella brassicaformis CCMP3155]|eukprot:CEM37006.1 unnamed protein product [Vitrella brassicaformis CCMP3155]
MVQPMGVSAGGDISTWKYVARYVVGICIVVAGLAALIGGGWYLRVHSPSGGDDNPPAASSVHSAASHPHLRRSLSAGGKMFNQIPPVDSNLGAGHELGKKASSHNIIIMSSVGVLLFIIGIWVCIATRKCKSVGAPRRELLVARARPSAPPHPRRPPNEPEEEPPLVTVGSPDTSPPPARQSSLSFGREPECEPSREAVDLAGQASALA